MSSQLTSNSFQPWVVDRNGWPYRYMASGDIALSLSSANNIDLDPDGPEEWELRAHMVPGPNRKSRSVVVDLLGRQSIQLKSTSLADAMAEADSLLALALTAKEIL